MRVVLGCMVYNMVMIVGPGVFAYIGVCLMCGTHTDMDCFVIIDYYVGCV